MKKQVNQRSKHFSGNSDGEPPFGSSHRGRDG
jgi:hypothetical protein